MSLDGSYSYNQSSSATLIEVLDEDAPITTAGEIEELRSSYNTSLGLAFGLPGDAQIRFTLPYIHRKSEANVLINGGEVDSTAINATGAADVSVSLAKTLFKEKGRRPDAIAQLTYSHDSSESDDGVEIDNNQESVALGVRATKRQDPLVFTYGISYKVHSEQDNFIPGAQTTVSASAVLAASPYTSLLLSFSHTFIDSAELDGAIVPGSKAIDSTINLGISSVIGLKTFMSAGVVSGLTDASNDFTAYVGFSRRFRY